MADRSPLPDGIVLAGEWLARHFRADCEQVGVQAAAALLEQADMPCATAIALAREALRGLRIEPFHHAGGIEWLPVPAWAIRLSCNPSAFSSALKEAQRRVTEYERSGFWSGSTYGYPPADVRQAWHEAMRRINA